MAEQVLATTLDLLGAMVAANGVSADDIASVIFTVTPASTSEFPARAGRDVEWMHVAVLEASEVSQEALRRCPECVDRPASLSPNARLEHTELMAVPGDLVSREAPSTSQSWMRSRFGWASARTTRAVVH